MEQLKSTILSFAAVFAIILLLFGWVVVRIVRLQTVQREPLEAIAANQESTNQPIPAQRGNIYDCRGRLLASSLPQYALYMDTRVEALHLDNGQLYHTYLDSMSQGLSHIIGDKTPQEYRQMIQKAYRGKTPKERDIRLCKERISYTQKKAIQQLPLIRRGYYKSGIHFIPQHRRVKPFGSLGSRTIGNIYGDNGYGKSGLEQRFESQLRGKDGISTRQRIAGSWQNIPEVEAVSGNDLVTTLDADLLDICETELRARLEKTQADWGCVVLMEVATGKIKALCNLDRDASGNYLEIANHAVRRVEPGSTFKTIALMAALDDGKITLDNTYRVWKDGWSYYNAKHFDSHPRDTVYTVRNALAVSSNQALAQLVVQSYHGSARKLVRKLEDMGLKDSIDFIIPGAQNARIDIPYNDTVTISRMAYGYSVEMSPLHSLVFYNAIANNGKMVAPMLVEQIRKDNHVQTFETKVVKNNICSKHTLQDIRACLHDVVWDNRLGTASVNPWGMPKAQSAMVPIAGKTGTAQLVEKGRYRSDRHRMSFVGYFPESDPQYSCICVIQHPHNYGYYDAGMDCGSVVRRIAEQTMVYAGEYVIQGDSLVFEHKKIKQ